MTAHSIDLDHPRFPVSWLVEFTAITGPKLQGWLRRGTAPQPAFRAGGRGLTHLWSVGGAVVFELMARLDAWGLPPAFGLAFGEEIVAELRRRQARGEGMGWREAFVLSEGAQDEDPLQGGSMLPLWGEFVADLSAARLDEEWRAWSAFHQGRRDDDPEWRPLNGEELEVLARREAGCVGSFRSRLILPVGWHVNSVLAVAEKGAAI